MVTHWITGSSRFRLDGGDLFYSRYLYLDSGVKANASVSSFFFNFFIYKNSENAWYTIIAVANK